MTNEERSLPLTNEEAQLVFDVMDLVRGDRESSRRILAERISWRVARLFGPALSGEPPEDLQGEITCMPGWMREGADLPGEGPEGGQSEAK